MTDLGTAAEARQDAENLQELLSTVVHDLSAPLRTLRGFSDLLKDTYPEGLDDKQLHLLSRIHHAATTMQTKLSTLTDFQHVTRGELEREPSSTQQIFDESLKLLTNSVEPGVFILSEDCPVLQVDRRTFSAALMELLKNAVAMIALDGEGAHHPRAISITPYQPAGGEPPGQGLVVTDTGLGITRQDPDALFKLFRRGNPATGQVGVGLTLARWIARRHGGDCWIRQGSPCAVVLLASLTSP
ncbi:MAG: ATP-binding protein [Lysobacterales bacterium]